MALEAQLRLFDLEQLLRRLAVVDAVASDAAHIALAMSSGFEVGVLSLMAAQAPRVYLLRGSLRRVEDLRSIAPAIHVCLPRSVAAFACGTGLSVHLSEPGMRIRGESLGNFLVARRARLLPHKVSRRRIRSLSFGARSRSLRTGCRGSTRKDQCRNEQYQDEQTHSQSRPCVVLLSYK